MNTDISTIVIALAFGIFVACAYSVYQKSVVGTFVKKLIEFSCKSENDAKSFSELGIGKLHAFLLSGSVSSKSPLRRFVSVIGAEKKNTDELFVKNESRKFFVSEENLEQVQKRYNTNGLSALVVLLALVLFAAVALLSFIFVPFLQNMVTGLINNF